jgi:sugar phosphate isomerase/epimerase
MKVTIEIDLPDGQEVPSAYDIVRLTDTDWVSEWWHISDVQLLAEDMKEKLSNDEAREVLRLVKKRHDCNVGINWDVINYWIEHVLDERKKK